MIALLALRAAAGRPRSMYSVPTRVQSQPTNGQSRISDFAMKVAGERALMTKMSSQEIWLSTSMQRPGRLSGAFLSRTVTERIDSSFLDQRRLRVSRRGFESHGKISEVIARPCSKCSISLVNRSRRTKGELRPAAMG